MKTILEIAKTICLDVGIAVPESFVARTEREYAELKSYSEVVCDDLCRLTNFGKLRKKTTFTGTGVAEVFGLPENFARTAFQGRGAARGGLSASEFASLSAISGTPRYFYLEQNTVQLWPYLPLGQTMDFYYQSSYWNGSGSIWTSDGDVALLPDYLIEKGTISRWRRQKGMDSAGYDAEFEAAKAFAARTDDAERSP